MFGIHRLVLAYSIIGVIAVIAVPWLALWMRRRYRENLRRRGIKRHGH